LSVRIEVLLAPHAAALGGRAPIVAARLRRRWPQARAALAEVYGDDGADALADALVAWAAQAVVARPHDLWELDLRREADPGWFQRSDALGYVCYVDRFAGDLSGVIERLDYLAELRVTYLHLMPLLRPRDGENDGGYAVASYDDVDPRLGTMADLERLTAALRARGISLCTDLVVNHTAKEHDWAVRARRGEAGYRERYFFFPDRAAPDAYERTLREVFPEFAPGNFTWYPDAASWVWTTFNEFQWDLDYANPVVFREMLAVMGRLANHGVEILRLDAVPFLWKRLGTDCENQPEAHALLRAFRAMLAVAAPATVFKAEAIVPPEQLVPYLGAGEPVRHECELAYHNQLMVMLWSSLATRDAALMTNALARMGEIPSHTAWVTYLRCHDDIGWAVTDIDAATVGWNGATHRRFLNDFYAGRFAGSYARGALFQENEATGDARISGSAASLCGIEDALARGDEAALDAACRRLELAYAVVFAFGGVPLVYMGDELALRNDRAYAAEAGHADDNRWLHRPRMDWDVAARRDLPGTLEHRTFAMFRRLAEARSSLPCLDGGARTTVRDTGDPRLLCLERRHPELGVGWVLANFSDDDVTVPVDAFAPGAVPVLAWGSAGAATGGGAVHLPALGYGWLTAQAGVGTTSRERHGVGPATA
jgi:amylosucrase